MAYKVCLLDSDPAYQRALMEYLNLRATIPIQLYVFSSPTVYKAFREKEKPALILVGDSYVDSLSTEECPVLVLTEKREYIGQEHYLFRYQNAEKLTEAMLAVIDKDKAYMLDRNTFLAVYSPLGRCGKTTFAKKLREQFSNGLYVNWEGVSEQSGDDGVGSWILYCMKSRNEECLEYLQEHLCRELPPPESFQDIRQIDVEDIRWLKQEMKKRQLYEGVVFDIGGMTLAGYAVLEAFDKVFVPVLKDDVSNRKIKVFEQMVQREQIDIPGLQYICREEMEAEQLASVYVR